MSSPFFVESAWLWYLWNWFSQCDINLHNCPQVSHLIIPDLHHLKHNPKKNITCQSNPKEQINRLQCPHQYNVEWCILLVSVKEQLNGPYRHQNHSIDLSHGKCPLHTVYIVKELIRQGWAVLLGWYSLMNHRDHNRGQNQVQNGIKQSDERLPPFWRQSVDLSFRHRNFDIVSVSDQSFPQAVPLRVFSGVAVDGARCARGWSSICSGSVCGILVSLVVFWCHECPRLPTNNWLPAKTLSCKALKVPLLCSDNERPLFSALKWCGRNSLLKKENRSALNEQEVHCRHTWNINSVASSNM